MLQVCEKLALVPGKLDHATVVAYSVGPYDSSEPPSPGDDRIVLPLDSKTHLNLRHHTRTKPGYATAISGFPCYATTMYDSAAPLASPDSARSIASQMEDFRMLPCAVMPPLPETSPPRTRVTLAREESVELLTESILEDAASVRAETISNKTLCNESLDDITVEIDKEYSCEFSEQNSKSSVELSGELVQSRRGSAYSSIPKLSDECAALSLNGNIEEPQSNGERSSRQIGQHQRLKDSKRVDDGASDVRTKSAREGNTAVIENRLAFSLKASSNKENVSPNVAFELPLKPVVETLL